MTERKAAGAPAGHPSPLRIFGRPSRLPKPTRVNVNFPGPYDLFVIDHARWVTLGADDHPEEFRVVSPGVYMRLARVPEVAPE